MNEANPHLVSFFVLGTFVVTRCSFNIKQLLTFELELEKWQSSSPLYSSDGCYTIFMCRKNEIGTRKIVRWPFALFCYLHSPTRFLLYYLFFFPTSILAWAELHNDCIVFRHSSLRLAHQKEREKHWHVLYRTDRPQRHEPTLDYQIYKCRQQRAMLADHIRRMHVLIA